MSDSPIHPANSAAAAARPCRALVIGLDAATWDIIDPMMARGELPNLARLAAGPRGPLRSTIPPQTFPAWPAIITCPLGPIAMEPKKNAVPPTFCGEVHDPTFPRPVTAAPCAWRAAAVRMGP